MSVPLIFDVRRGSTEDGPGIRTTVFFKGCNLRCAWCHNPEAIDPDEEIGFYGQQCIGCGDCAKICGEAACRLDEPGRIDRSRCNRCGACADACPARALRRIGRTYSFEELMELLLMDAPFYRVSGGGVTLSGGEPTLHMEYAGEVLRRLHESAVHTAIETNGLFAWDKFRDMMLPYIDLIMMDVKVVDPLKHGTHTGASNAANELIIENLRRLVRECPSRLLPRVPLIPEFTVTADNLGDIAELFRSLGITRYALLPYNPTWFHKAAAIGRPIDPRLPARMLTRDEVNAFRACFAESSVSASAPHEKGMDTTNGATYKEETSGKPDTVKTGVAEIHGTQARRGRSAAEP